ncbi:MAG: tetratricopeptide repeat protein [Rhodospirillaceae bacterium]|nr:tetratricopeptide repeat protein [Rhodospirillaceae bacterium]
MNKPTSHLKLLERAVNLHRSARLAEAQALYREVLAIDPGNPDALNLLGLATHDLGDSAAALPLLEKAIALKPDFAAACFNLANCYRTLNRATEAIAALRQAIALKPSYSDAYLNLGVAYYQLGDFRQAMTTFDAYIAQLPRDPRGYKNKGYCLVALGDDVGAVHALEFAVHLDRKDCASIAKLANAYARTDKLDKAVETMKQACALEPKNGEYFSNLGTWLTKLEFYADAFAAHQTACRLEPDRAEFHYNYGSDLYADGRFEQAVEELSKATELRPDFIDALINLMETKVELGADSEAHDLLAKVKLILDAGEDLDPGKRADAATNRALVLLALGSYREGWNGYRQRFEKPKKRFSPRAFPYPELTGDMTGVKRLLIWTEQGIGDEIMMLSMLPDAIAHFQDCIVECSPRLVPLVQRSFPAVRVVGLQDPPHDAIRQFAPDAHTSIADLGGLFRRDFNAFPVHRGYLVADPERRATFRQTYRELAGTRPVVGIVWRSNAPDTGRFKSIPIAQFARILDTDDAWFVSLQYGDAGDDLAVLAPHIAQRIFFDQRVDSVKDLDGFAAQVGAMDLVISISNTAVHFAGALNIPVWTLVPKGPGAIWYFRTGQASPWYPSARLFRQHKPRQWEQVVQDVKSALDHWCRNRVVT